jgi:hypothetical protein
MSAKVKKENETQSGSEPQQESMQPSPSLALSPEQSQLLDSLLSQRDMAQANLHTPQVTMAKAVYEAAAAKADAAQLRVNMAVYQLFAESGLKLSDYDLDLSKKQFEKKEPK